MIVLIVMFLAAFVYADELGYTYRSGVHRSSRGYTSSSNSLTRSESIQRPVSYTAPVGFGGFQTEFYTFTAPEDVFDDHATVQKIAESLRKKIQVVFIKNPENTAYENALLSLIEQTARQKTAIYVLNKQHDLSDLAEKINVIQSDISRKPEVHFVKYRTPEDAYNAQRAIQGHYDSLRDAAPSYNAASTAELNFNSPAPKNVHGSFQTPNSEYLPPAIYPGSNV